MASEILILSIRLFKETMFRLLCLGFHQFAFNLWNIDNHAVWYWTRHDELYELILLQG